MLCFFQMIAAFERYLKELAAVCVDEVAPLATDNRLGEFSIGGDDAAPHVQDQTIGRALCETALWHDIDKVNERFKKILRYPNDPNKDPFQLFPSKASSPPEARLFPSKAEARSKVDTLRYLFQLRHSIAHNLGHVTRSDGNKVERLLKAKIQPKPGVLSLERKHVYYLQRFLEPVVDEINDVVATRLTLVLTEFEKQMPALMDLNAIADRLARLFQTSVTVGGITRTP